MKTRPVDLDDLSCFVYKRDDTGPMQDFFHGHFWGSLSTNQDSMECSKGFDQCSGVVDWRNDIHDTSGGLTRFTRYLHWFPSAGSCFLYTYDRFGNRSKKVLEHLQQKHNRL